MGLRLSTTCNHQNNQKRKAANKTKIIHLELSESAIVYKGDPCSTQFTWKPCLLSMFLA
jgi:hypothetical protein